MDEYCVINIIDSPCDVVVNNDTLKCNCDSLNKVITSISDHCKDDLRYPSHNPTLNGGTVVEATTIGRNSIKDFSDYLNTLFRAHGTLAQPLPTNRGVYLSKQVFDRIFDDNTSANGVVVYFGLDATKMFNVIIDPVSTDNGNYSIQLPLTATPADFIPVFMANEHSLCPAICGDHDASLN